MAIPRLEDRLAFLLSVAKVEPEVRASLLALPRPVERKQIDEWARRWNLAGPGLEWVADEVWRDGPDRDFPPVVSGAIPTHDRSLVLTWEPADTGEDRAKFLARARAALAAYADQVEEWAKAEGVRLPRERNSNGVNGIETGLPRWDLLASYVVHGMTLEAIGLDVGLSRQAVTKHIRALALRLGVNAT